MRSRGLRELNPQNMNDDLDQIYMLIRYLRLVLGSVSRDRHIMHKISVELLIGHR
jgi:hypothetical protein